MENKEKDLNTNMSMAVPKISPTEKVCLTVEEAAGVFGIGDNTIRRLIAKNPTAKYLLHIGNKTLIKRKLFEEFINNEYDLT